MLFTIDPPSADFLFRFTLALVTVAFLWAIIENRQRDRILGELSRRIRSFERECSRQTLRIAGLHVENVARKREMERVMDVVERIGCGRVMGGMGRVGREVVGQMREGGGLDGGHGGGGVWGRGGDRYGEYVRTAGEWVEEYVRQGRQRGGYGGAGIGDDGHDGQEDFQEEAGEGHHHQEGDIDRQQVEDAVSQEAGQGQIPEVRQDDDDHGYKQGPEQFKGPGEYQEPDQDLHPSAFELELEPEGPFDLDASTQPHAAHHPELPPYDPSFAAHLHRPEHVGLHNARLPGEDEQTIDSPPHVRVARAPARSNEDNDLEWLDGYKPRSEKRYAGVWSAVEESSDEETPPPLPPRNTHGSPSFTQIWPYYAPEGWGEKGEPSSRNAHPSGDQSEDWDEDTPVGSDDEHDLGHAQDGKRKAANHPSSPPHDEHPGQPHRNVGSHPHNGSTIIGTKPDLGFNTTAPPPPTLNPRLPHPTLSETRRVESAFHHLRNVHFTQHERIINTLLERKQARDNRQLRERLHERQENGRVPAEQAVQRDAGRQYLNDEEEREGRAPQYRGGGLQWFTRSVPIRQPELPSTPERVMVPGARDLWDPLEDIGVHFPRPTVLNHDHRCPPLSIERGRVNDHYLNRGFHRYPQSSEEGHRGADRVSEAEAYIRARSRDIEEAKRKMRESRD